MSIEYIESKTALVLGASSGIGLAVSRVLHEMGMKVIGIGRVFPSDFPGTKIAIDVHKSGFEETLKRIYRSEDISVLVNSLGVAYYGFHENISVEEISLMVRTNLEIPMISSSIALKHFREKGGGYIINISSVTSDSVNPFGACYGATKSGISSFMNSIREEARKVNIKVIDIKPDITKTNLYRNADIMPSDVEGSFLLPEDVANVVKTVLLQRDNTFISEVKIVPQYRRISKKRLDD